MYQKDKEVKNMKKLKCWKRENPKDMHILSEGAKEYAIDSWEKNIRTRWGTYPAVVIVPNVGGGHNVEVFGIGRGIIKSFFDYESKSRALSFAQKFMEEHDTC